jgi:dTMP kinase
MFIVLEGIDGCGKSTQARLLAKWLENEGLKVCRTSEPSGSRIGLFIRDILSGKADVDPKTLALLFTADRFEHLRNEVKPALEQGSIVVCERYYHSTIAYQSAQGVDKAWLQDLNRFVLEPDLVLFIDVRPEVSLDRKEGREIFEDKEFLEKVYDEYSNFDEMKKIDGTRQCEEVFEDIKASVSPLLKR